jgi:hypothetical protein
MTTKDIVCTTVFLVVCILFVTAVLVLAKKTNPLRQFTVTDQKLKALSFNALGNNQIGSYGWGWRTLAYALITGYLIIRQKPILLFGTSYFRIPFDCLDIDVDPEPWRMSLSTEKGVLKWDAGTDLVSEIRTFTGR